MEMKNIQELTLWKLPYIGAVLAANRYKGDERRRTPLSVHNEEEKTDRGF